jgi:hypothetical protein
MRFSVGSLLAFLVACILARAQTVEPAEIHVQPPASKEGVRMSLGTSASPPPSSPEATKSLQELASANGVDIRPDVPWHLEFAYDEFDEDGDNVHSGTVEEVYVSPKKFRKVIKTDEFSQTEVADGSDLYRAGDQNWPPQSERQAEKALLSPLYEASGIANSSANELDWTISKTTLPCVVLRNGRILSPNGMPKFCYEPGSTRLRYTRGQGWDETVYNSIVQFKGRYMAREVEVTHAAKPFLKIHLTRIEADPQPEDSLFLSPTGSPGPLAGVVTVPSAILMEYVVHREFPTNVPRGSHGKVTVKFRVGKDGRVVHAQATDGPRELKRPVEENMKKTQFRLFLILDKPVEVESTTLYTFQ